MANGNGTAARIESIDKRLSALEGEGLDDSAALTRITKLFADIEIEIAFKYKQHQYHVVGRTVEAVEPTGVSQRQFTLICGPNTII